MIPFSTFRAVLRIPFFRKNCQAIYLLNKVFYLMLALYRLRRIQDFLFLQKIYFLLIDSFVSYGVQESREILDQLLDIPWFSERRKSLYHTIACYRRLIQDLKDDNGNVMSADMLKQYKQDTITFVDAFKQLMDFDAMDEARVNALIEDQSVFEDALQKLFKAYPMQT